MNEIGEDVSEEVGEGAGDEGDEEILWNKGLKYNLPLHKQNFNIRHILTEVASAETVIKAINEQKEQDEARFIINNKFNKIICNQLNNILSPCLLYTSRCV